MRTTYLLAAIALGLAFTGRAQAQSAGARADSCATAKLAEAGEGGIGRVTSGQGSSARFAEGEGGIGKVATGSGGAAKLAEAGEGGIGRVTSGQGGSARFAEGEGGIGKVAAGVGGMGAGRPANVATRPGC
jgi:hypothetical protein